MPGLRPAAGPGSPLTPATAFCTRCHTDLETTNGRSITAGLACAIATFVLLFPANLFPLLKMNIFGMHADNVIGAGVLGLWGRQWILLAGLSWIFVVILPFLRFGLLIAVLAAVRLGYRESRLGPVFRWGIWLDMWAMFDVFLLAGCVGFYRLDNVSQAHLAIAIGGQCFVAAALLTMLTRATLDKRTVWRAIGGSSVIEPGASTVACTTCDLVQPRSQEGGASRRLARRVHQNSIRVRHQRIVVLALRRYGLDLRLPELLCPPSCLVISR